MPYVQLEVDLFVFVGCRGADDSYELECKEWMPIGQSLPPLISPRGWGNNKSDRLINRCVF